MKKLSLIMFTFYIIILGCAHTHKIDLASEPSTFDEINTILKSQKAKITLANEDEFVGKGPQIASDSAIWSDPSTNHRHTVSTLEVEKIVVLKRSRGALEGLMYGALIGGATGLIIGFVEGTEAENPGYGPDFDTPTWVLLGAINAGLIGLPIGAMVGSKDKYILIGKEDSYANWRGGPHFGFSHYTGLGLGVEIQKDHFGFCLGLPGNIGFKYYPNKEGYSWFFGINAVNYKTDTEETKNGDKYDEKQIHSVGLGAGHKWRFKKHWDLTISLSINFEREELYGDGTYRDQYVMVWPGITLGYTF